MEFPREIIDKVQELRGAAKAESQRIRAEANAAAQKEKVLDKCCDFLTKGWPLHLRDLIDKEKNQFKKLRQENHPSIPSIEKAYRLAKEESDRIVRRFPDLLEEAFVNTELSLDSDSRHPKYSLEQGFFQLAINDQKRTARLSNYEGRLPEMPADIQAIVEAVQGEHERIFGRFNGKKFLKQLRSHYKAIIKKEKKQDGDSVPIRQIASRLGGTKKKGPRTDEFLVNISRLAEKGPFEIDDRILDLQQTKDTDQGMLLQGAAARGYVGFIVFKEEVQ